MKRNLIIILVFLIILIAGFFCFFRDEVSVNKDTSLKKAVPVTSPFFFEFNSIRDLPADNHLISELSAADIATPYFNFFKELDSLIINSDEIADNLRNTGFILSFSIAGREELVPLIIVKAESNSRKNRFEELIALLYPAEKYSYSKKEYGNTLITEINPGHDRIFYAFTGKFLLISTQSLQIEQSLRQLGTTGILNDEYFVEVYNSAKSQGISLFVNHSNFPGFLRNILNRTPVSKVDEFGETSRYITSLMAENFRDFASWTGLDFRLSNEYLLLNGTSAVDDSLNHFLSVFNGQQSVNIKADQVLPRNTSFFCNYSFSGKSEFFDRLETYFSYSDFYYRREERMKRFERGMNADVRKVFRDLVKSEIVLAATTIPVEPQNKTVFFIIQTENRSNAEEQIKNLLLNYAKRTQKEIKEMTSEYVVNENTHYTIYQFPYPSFPGIWLGVPFSMAEARYVSFFDTYIVFSNSEQGLNQYLRSVSAGSTLAKDTRYNRVKQRSNNNANISIYLDINKAFGFGKEIFTNSLMEDISEREESLRKFSSIGWQVQNDKDRYLNSFIVDYNPDVPEEAQTIWQSTIGTNINLKPELTINHYNQDRREIVIQDNNNMVHQVTADGLVRWSVPVSGPVLGRIHQVDYFKNGKLQYLFNTREKLYLIDRDGNNVAHFPVAFKSPATNGVSVFDYDNNRNYRYFVAGEDKRIYVYDYSAKIVDGWGFGQSEFPVLTPVQHCRIDGKDYIIFKDESRIYILDRQGEERVAVKANFTYSDNSPVILTAGKPRIAVTDRTGKVYYIGFDGTLEEKRSSRFSENHRFIVDDLDGNNVYDFIYTDGNEITVVDENGRRKFSRKMKNPINHPPSVYTFAENLKKISVIDAFDNHIYLFNPDGKLHDGFPLQGNSEFTIGKLTGNAEGLNLLVGSEGGKLLNYSLN
ncbi:MAG: hypothetical protein PHH93_00780 [Prolixibacteraceae bacterium]|nr:hypothetical protein [Prolixibacteraceae bacterium]